MAQAVAAIRKPRIIKRPRLTRMLDECGARIILLLAPAGYGKTTLAREWLSQGGRRYAWYSAGPESADVAALAAGVARAFEALAPGAAQRVLSRLRASEVPSKEVSVLVDMLLEALGNAVKGTWIAVDDYQFVIGSNEAEMFLEELTRRGNLSILLASRERPSWCPTRRAIYGEVFEVDRDSLAMTETETAAVLRTSSDPLSAASGPASGWPAVIGLASLTAERQLPPLASSSALYDYFAEELYQAVSKNLRWPMCQLALGPRPTLRIAQRLFGPELAENLITEGCRVGLFSPAPDGVLTIHPLLVDFMRIKFAEHAEDQVKPALARLIDTLSGARQWDDAFALIETSGEVTLLPALTSAAMPTLLSEGRLTTLQRWLALADEHALAGPVFNLAEAELALRRGNAEVAETLALQVAKVLTKVEGISASLAWSIAGRAAHFRDQYETAFKHHRMAAETATTDAEVRAGVWGQLIALIHLEADDSKALIQRFARLTDHTIEHTLRVEIIRLISATHRGSIVDVVESLPGAVALAGKSNDPWLQTNALNVAAGIYLIAGEYDEALRLGEAEREAAERYHLEFVSPSAYNILAAAELGRRNFIHAARLLDLAESTAHAIHDYHNLLDATVIRLRLLLAQHDSDAAVHLASTARVVRRPDRAMYGEYLGVCALTHACHGDLEEARSLVSRTVSTTRAIHAAVNSVAALAIVDLRHRSGVKSSRPLQMLVSKVRETGNVDSLIAAYRAHPPLLKALASIGDFRDELIATLVRGRDRKAAYAAGLQLPRPAPDPDTLSPREREVLELVVLGLSNGEIANRLFISTVTVKAHIRHIFQKLGVTSRTEAVRQALS